MRFLCFLFLVAFAGAVGLFAYENQQSITLKFYNWEVTATVAAVIGAAFGLGMLSGWSIVGMLRRSIHRLTDAEQRERMAAGR
jgi:hypothetical protein